MGIAVAVAFTLGAGACLAYILSPEKERQEEHIKVVRQVALENGVIQIVDDLKAGKRCYVLHEEATRRLVGIAC